MLWFEEKLKKYFRGIICNPRLSPGTTFLLSPCKALKSRAGGAKALASGQLVSDRAELGPGLSHLPFLRKDFQQRAETT